VRLLASGRLLLFEGSWWTAACCASCCPYALPCEIDEIISFGILQRVQSTGDIHEADSTAPSPRGGADSSRLHVQLCLVAWASEPPALSNRPAWARPTKKKSSGTRPCGAPYELWSRSELTPHKQLVKRLYLDSVRHLVHLPRVSSGPQLMASTVGSHFIVAPASLSIPLCVLRSICFTSCPILNDPETAKRGRGKVNVKDKKQYNAYRLICIGEVHKARWRRMCRPHSRLNESSFATISGFRGRAWMGNGGFPWALCSTKYISIAH